MSERSHNHYFKDVKGLDVIDVYRLLELFEVTCPVAQHIVKKALAAGKRGAKDATRDMKDIADSAERWLHMRDEDAARNGFAAFCEQASFDGPDVIKAHQHTGLPHGLTWETAPVSANALVGNEDPEFLIWVPEPDALVTGWLARPVGVRARGALQTVDMRTTGNAWHVVAVRPTARSTPPA